MDDLRARLASCFSAVFADLSESEIPRATMTSVADWDSLATVNLVGVIEEEFGIQVPPADLEQFVSFEKILEYLRQQAGA